MPTTRRQATLEKSGELTKPDSVNEPLKIARGKGRKAKKQDEEHPAVGEKRGPGDNATGEENHRKEPHSKKPKVEDEAGNDQQETDFTPLTGTIERGHIYFFYRTKVQIDEAKSLQDVRNFHIVLVPRPPAVAAHEEDNKVGKKEEDEDTGMKVLLSEGADAVPAAESKGQAKKKFRVITVGKKQLPDPDSGGSGRGRKETFWAAVTTVGDDLHKLEGRFGEKEYETKTRGTRHEGPARLVGRGAYAIVNNDPSVPSKRETHLGYHLSHPSSSELGDVQEEMRIYSASSFILQLRNPLAPVSGGQRVGLPQPRRADYPEKVMQDVFGEGTKGREEYGLRFSSIVRPELLDYEGAELLLIGARSGDEGLDTSLGEGRGSALNETSEKDSEESIQDVLKELAMDEQNIPAEPLKGEWL